MTLYTPHPTIVNFSKTKKGKTKLFIKDIYKTEITMFGTVAGLAGVAIYLVVKWQMGLKKSSDGFFPVSNKDLKQFKTKIHRNTKYEALKKLRDEKLIEYYSEENSGKSTMVRILTK
jgi:hypothetical protein